MITIPLYLYHILYLNLCALPVRDEEKDDGKDKEERCVLASDLWVIESSESGGYFGCVLAICILGAPQVECLDVSAFGVC